MGLWGSIAAIQEASPRVGEFPSNDFGQVIEITLLTGDEGYAKFIREVLFGYVSDADKDIIRSKEELLGFDVADRLLISGISNCQLDRDELTAIRSEWAYAINDNGLVREVRLARNLRSVCDRLIPEHAPFEIYRIQRVESVRPT